jgi:hypothetical protein
MTTSAHRSPRRLLTREDVLDGRAIADLLHLPISTVLEYARRGLLPGHKLGRRWVFLTDEVEEAVRGAPVPTLTLLERTDPGRKARTSLEWNHSCP